MRAGNYHDHLYAGYDQDDRDDHYHYHYGLDNPDDVADHDNYDDCDDRYDQSITVIFVQLMILLSACLEIKFASKNRCSVKTKHIGVQYFCLVGEI